MFTEDAPTKLLLDSVRRQTEAQGVPMVTRRKGDPTTGSILLKLNLCDGTSLLLTQTRYGDEKVWTFCLDANPVPDEEAESYLTRQAALDPDLWLIEIEDKESRHWFPNRLIQEVN